MLRKATIYWHDDHGSFTEQYMEGERGSFPEGHLDPELWCRDLVQRFNETLRRGELPRTVDRVEVVGTTDKIPLDHDWHKTNDVTISDRLGLYDTMQCTRCFVTGKRFGVGSLIKLDSKFKAPAFQTCRGAIRLLAQRRQKEGSDGR